MREVSNRGMYRDFLISQRDKLLFGTSFIAAVLAYIQPLECLKRWPYDRSNLSGIHPTVQILIVQNYKLDCFFSRITKIPIFCHLLRNVILIWVPQVQNDEKIGPCLSLNESIQVPPYHFQSTIHIQRSTYGCLVKQKVIQNFFFFFSFCNLIYP